MFNKTTAYIEKLLQPDSKDSVKSFSMFVSVLCGIFLTLCLGTSLLIDVVRDGVLDSDMYGCAAYVVSVGAMIGLSSMPKAIVDKAQAISHPNTEPGSEAIPTSRRRKKKEETEELG